MAASSSSPPRSAKIPIPAEDFDFDTDEIRSLASDDLYENRPNRWRGPPARWLRYTEEERHLARSLDDLRRRDLAVHLYNAFALKRDRRVTVAHEAKASQHPETPAEWAPPRAWTAWPLQPRDVPEHDFVHGPENDVVLDGLEAYTLRREPIADYPRAGEAVEEEIIASILRTARRRCVEEWRGDELEDGRQSIGHEDEGQDEDEQDTTAMDVDDLSPAVKLESQPENEDSRPWSPVGDRLDVTSRPLVSAPSKKRRPQLGAVVSSNDELSHAILLPTARHIISKLNNTLKVLHNTRIAAARSGAPYAGSDDEELLDDTDRGRTASEMGRGRRSGSLSSWASTPGRSQSRRANWDGLTTAQIVDLLENPPDPKHRGSRGNVQRRFERLPGETDKQLVVRAARLQKKLIPQFSDDDDDDDDDKDTACKTEDEGGKTPTRVPGVALFPRTGETQEEFEQRKKRDLEKRNALALMARAGFYVGAKRRALDDSGNPVLYGTHQPVTTKPEPEPEEEEDSDEEPLMRGRKRRRMTSARRPTTWAGTPFPPPPPEELVPRLAPGRDAQPRGGEYIPPAWVLAALSPSIKPGFPSFRSRPGVGVVLTQSYPAQLGSPYGQPSSGQPFSPGHAAPGNAPPGQQPLDHSQRQPGRPFFPKQTLFPGQLPGQPFPGQAPQLGYPLAPGPPPSGQLPSHGQPLIPPEPLPSAQWHLPFGQTPPPSQLQQPQLAHLKYDPGASYQQLPQATPPPAMLREPSIPIKPEPAPLWSGQRQPSMELPGLHTVETYANTAVPSSSLAQQPLQPPYHTSNLPSSQAQQQQEQPFSSQLPFHSQLPPSHQPEVNNPAIVASGYHPRSQSRPRSKPRKRTHLPHTPFEKTLKTLALRDWSDVISAAALAGFSSSVVARTAQRCADLFGQSMSLATMREQPVWLPGKRYATALIAPGGGAGDGDDEGGGDSEEEVERVRRARLVNRREEVWADVRRETMDERRGRVRDRRGDRDSIAGARSKSLMRSLSRARALSTSGHWCPILSCNRATSSEPFRQRRYLIDHLVRVHGYARAKARVEAGMDLPDDNLSPTPDPGNLPSRKRARMMMDEDMLGAIHTDGFLRPIITQEWRKHENDGNTGKRKDEKEKERGRQREGTRWERERERARRRAERRRERERMSEDEVVFGAESE